MMKLTPSDIFEGMRVAYVPAAAEWDRSAIEYGTVSSYKCNFVFVKFDKQLQKFGWNGTTSQACNIENLVGI